MTFVTFFFIIMLLYVSGLLWLALRVERTPRLRQFISSNPYVYSLALTIYMTAWTFYGNVGQAVQSGMMYLISFIGTFFGVMMWWWVLRRIVRIKNRNKITSISDFVSARYGKSHFVAGLVALVFFVGSLPYVAIQFKAILTTLGIMLYHDAGGQGGASASVAGPAILLFTILFTILAGVRHLDPTERHPGVASVIALESFIKLAVFCAVGIFVTYGMYDGFADLFSKGVEAGYRNLFSIGQGEGRHLDWVARVFIFAPAILLLPRQFHVAVIENSDESHIRTAMWVLPLYMFLMIIFVIPIALAGLLSGYDASLGDWFVLLIPMNSGHHWLGMMVFMGGFSAGMSMIVVTTMTMATMISNDLLLPVLHLFPGMTWLRRYILQFRWAVVCVYLTLSYVLYLAVGESYTLVTLGVVSMVAAIQLVPATLGGLYWEDGNRAGAVSGLLAGFLVWGYTLILPIFARSGIVDATLLSLGPFGVEWLHPEHLFGLHVFQPLMHTVFWSLLLNSACYVVFSCLWTPKERDIETARDFVYLFDMYSEKYAESSNFVCDISLDEKKGILVSLFKEYYPLDIAVIVVSNIVRAAHMDELKYVSVVDLATLASESEKQLAGVVGSASANKTIKSSQLFTIEERDKLTSAYKGMLANLRISPEELLRRLDYYKERESLLQEHADELGTANAKLLDEMIEKEKIQQELALAEERYRSIFENAVEGIFQTLPEGKIVHANPATATILGYDSIEDLIGTISNLKEELYVLGDDRERFVSLLASEGAVGHFETQMYRKNGSTIWVAIHARAITDEDGNLVLIEGILEDISNHKRAEEEMLRANRFVRSIIDAMPSAMIAVSSDQRVVHWNREAESRYSITKDNAVGKAFLQLLPWLYPLEEQIQSAFETGEIQHRNRLSEELGGEVHILDVVVYPLEALDTSPQVVLRLDDATSRVRLEEVMVQTEKMMSVGGLAAGMAHEINNPLGAILLGVQNVMRRIESKRPANEVVANAVGLSLDRMNEYLEQRKVLEILGGVRLAGERAATIVANMLEFSRRSESSFASVSVSHLLDKAVELAANDYDLKKKYDFRQVKIVREYAEGIPGVYCNSTEIEQVILNLLRNAAQAMYEDQSVEKEPCITLRTSREGRMVRLEVADNGPGMDDSVRRRVFEPFFTTKSVGVGTGLGLSVSYFIITTNHSGQFMVETRKGQGTTFTILLPFGKESEEALTKTS